MELGIIIYSNDPETTWSAFRLGIFSRKQGDNVTVFLLGEGMEVESLSRDKFDITGQIHSFLDTGGAILACGTVLSFVSLKN